MLKPLVTAALLALALTAGCADRTSHEALLEQAAMAIDKADYASAVAILEGLCPDETACSDEVLALLAQARMGVAGVDTLNLLTAFDTPGPIVVFDTLDAMFGTGGVDPSDVAALGAAITSLQNVDQPTAAEQLDLALAAATHLVASIRDAADPGYSGTWTAPTVGTPEMAVLTDAINADLVLIQDNVAAVEAALGEPSTLTTQIDLLIGELSGGALPVTEAQVAAYIGTL